MPRIMHAQPVQTGKGISMNAKEQLLEFINSLTQKEVEIIIANFAQIAASAAVLTGKEG